MDPSTCTCSTSHLHRPVPGSHHACLRHSWRILLPEAQVFHDLGSTPNPRRPWRPPTDSDAWSCGAGLPELPDPAELVVHRKPHLSIKAPQPGNVHRTGCHPDVIQMSWMSWMLMAPLTIELPGASTILVVFKEHEDFRVASTRSSVKPWWQLTWVVPSKNVTFK